MNDAESQQASIPKDYGTIPVSADAGGSARRVVIALAAIALFASGVAVGSSIATTPRGASVVYSGQHGVWCNYNGQIVPCGDEVKFTPQMRPLSPPSRKTHPSHPNLAKLPPVDSINQWSYLDNGQISENGNIVAQGKKPAQLVAQDRSGGGGGCSPGFTGFAATKDCRGYFLCTNGKAGTVMKCPSGTLFDTTITACAFATTVTGCGT